MATLTIIRPGMFTTVQDLGRWGYQSSGVPVSGALDWVSHRLANRLLGNDVGAATLEVTLTGPHVQFENDTMFAVTGAGFRLTLNDAAVPMNQAVAAGTGSVLRFGQRERGARAYFAVGGGVDVPEVLGSRSTHVMASMGGYQGRALRAGDRIPLGETRGRVEFSYGSRKFHPTPLFGRRLRVVPVDERLTRDMMSRPFRVSPRSDRMGYRLESDKALAASTGTLISSAVPTGAIQVPPTGEPILLMNDHATTGGYAVAAVVIGADLPVAGQLAPGDSIEFAACSLEDADQALRQREDALGVS